MAIVLTVIAVGLLLLWGAYWTSERHKVDVEQTQFDQYELPSREDFDFDGVYEDLVTEGVVFYGLKVGEIDALIAFAADKEGWLYGDIFRAFYRAQLGIA